MFAGGQVMTIIHISMFHFMSISKHQPIKYHIQRLHVLLLWSYTGYTAIYSLCIYLFIWIYQQQKCLNKLECG